MNNSEANAVNVLARVLSGTPDWRGEMPTVEQQQAAVDLLLAGAYRKLSAGLQPGHATVQDPFAPLRDLPVRGYCPACAGQTLFRGRPDGAVLCGNPACPSPGAAQAVLDDGEIEHIVVLDEHTFTVKHPLRERLNDALLSCTVHTALTAANGPPALCGTYRVRPLGPDLWSWELVLS